MDLAVKKWPKQRPRPTFSRPNISRGLWWVEGRPAGLAVFKVVPHPHHPNTPPPAVVAKNIFWIPADTPRYDVSYIVQRGYHPIPLVTSHHLKLFRSF